MHPRTSLSGLLVAATLFLCPLSTRAEGLQAGPGDRVGLDVPLDATVTAVGLAVSGLPELLGSQLAPASCRWCEGAAGTPRVNAVDGFFHDRLTGAIVSRETAGTLSSVVAYGFAPAVALGGAFVATGPHATPGAGLRAAVLVIESTAVAGAIAQPLKFLVARVRPFARYGHAGAAGSGYDASDFDARLSFPSGHTTIAAALGASIATTATLEESAAAPWLWGTAGVLTASTAALRIMAEKHYFTDVLAGAVIGTGCGIAVPLLHRKTSWSAAREVSATVMTPATGGAGIAIAGLF